MAFRPYGTGSKLLGAGATLQNNIPEITGKMAEVVSAAIEEKAEEIAAAARSRAPVGNPSTDPHSGRLRDSIEVEQYNEPGAVGWRVVATAESPTGAPYPFFVEFGTRHMAAQPFLYPAFDERVADTIKAVGEVLEDL
jgi:HK97 gp10 family phage protein